MVSDLTDRRHLSRTRPRRGIVVLVDAALVEVVSAGVWHFIPDHAGRAAMLRPHPRPNAPAQQRRDSHHRLGNAAVDPAGGFDGRRRRTRAAVPAATRTTLPATPTVRHTSTMTELPTAIDYRLQLRNLHGEAARHAVPVLAWALHPSPLGVWLYPSPNERSRSSSERNRRLCAVLRRLIDDAAADASVILAEQGGTTVGAALRRTCPARSTTDPVPAVLTPDPQDSRLTTLAEQIGRRHPPQEHDHLLALGVVRGRERQGIAGALLTSPITTLPARPRLVVTPGRLQGVLHELGYQPYGLPIRVGDGCPQLHPLWYAAPLRPRWD